MTVSHQGHTSSVLWQKLQMARGILTGGRSTLVCVTAWLCLVTPGLTNHFTVNSSQMLTDTKSLCATVYTYCVHARALHACVLYIPTS